MSVIIISGGGDGHAAMDKLVAASPNMTPIQIAQAEALLAKFISDVTVLLLAVKKP